jgi:cellulose synthase/poly-beta-1,6-N-acetylglucosamine synthase-like glycosyltransferase
LLLPLILLLASAAVVAWVYAGYPLLLLTLGRVRPRPRERRPTQKTVSILVAAHNEERVIEGKVANVLSTRYPRSLVEIVVVSDGSTDGTVEAARRAGAHRVLDLRRVGKIKALNAGVEAASGEILVFTDADSLLSPDTLDELIANFTDPAVGGVATNEVSGTAHDASGVRRGEGLYWRYDQWIKRLEDRVGSTVSASGRLYAIRRSLFRPSTVTAGSDDFVISTQVIKAGRRLAFDERAIVLVDAPNQAAPELRRKVRVMNRGTRAALSLGELLLPWRGGFYAIQLLSHQVVRRLVPFFLVAAFAANVWLTAISPVWWTLLGPQVVFYGLALAGWAGRDRGWGRARPLWVSYYFCLANTAAAAAVLSVVGGVRFERWDSGQRARKPVEADARLMGGWRWARS